MTYFTCAAFGMLIVRYHTNNIYAKINALRAPHPTSPWAVGLAPGILARSALLVATFPRGKAGQTAQGAGGTLRTAFPTGK